MKRPTRGFTLIELLVVIVLAAIVTSLVVRSLGDTSSRFAVNQARNVFVSMAARARAQAIESGMTTLLIMNAPGDSAWIFANGRVVENVRFAEELGIDVQAAANNIRVCMSPRGYADTDCNSFSNTIQLRFVQGGQSEAIEILPLGQVRW